ncbi:MAG: zinc-dependent metalloprotease, partial [Pyrinomonadaceae bacterium]
EVIKGDVTLDSQRARQDFLLGAGMSPQYRSSAMACEFGLSPDVDYLAADNSAAEITSMSYARIRQLSAHEVGHTLGFTHNFAASTYDRGSVMDYPAPLVKIVNGKLDFSDAYAVGIGSFDKFATRYSYAQFPAAANEDAELQRIVAEGIASGMLFLGDQDARPANAANPLGNLWDNGPDPVAVLRHEMKVRRIGLDQFGVKNIPVGSPMSYLENVFLPLYLHHRYQLTAAAKTVGGVYYTHAVRGPAGPEPSPIAAIVPADKQRDALKAILETIDPKELAIPENVLGLIPPTAYGYGSGRSELFQKRTSPMFDPVGAAEIAADVAISALLEPNRAARTISQTARNKQNPHFREVVTELVKTAWKAAPADANQVVIQRAVQSIVVSRLMDLAANERAQSQVRAVASDTLRSLLATLKKGVAIGEAAAFNRALVDDLTRFIERPDAPRKQTAPLATPPGDPIGN